MSTTFTTAPLDLAGVRRMAELVAVLVRAGDVVALEGDLGAGKSTFARFLIAAMLGDDGAEVPSPTFTLVQPYATPRMSVLHYDFYRLSGADEVRELGFEAAIAGALSLVEWPERAAAALPAERLEIRFVEGVAHSPSPLGEKVPEGRMRGQAGTFGSDRRPLTPALSPRGEGAEQTSPPPCGEGAGVGGSPVAADGVRDTPSPRPSPQGVREQNGAIGEGADTRILIIRGTGSWAARVGRIAAIEPFLERTGWAGARIAFLQGDASPRRYARLSHGACRAVLMDSPRMPDGPPVRDGLPYSRIAHLAEDVRPFVAVSAALSEAGLNAPEVLAHDLDAGLLLIEDLGDRVYGREIAAGRSMEELYRQAVDALVALRRAPVPASLPLSDGTLHHLPEYDRRALGIEVELLTDWYWPAAKGAPCPAPERAEFLDLFHRLIGCVLAGPKSWTLRDYHSPNLMWLPERRGLARVGVLDFQDAMRGHPAYDLVSLLQDARLDVPSDLEARLLGHYCAAVAGECASFDEGEHRAAYAILGAQRNTKILGIFARLARRDGKRDYLRHMPRIWGYLERDLAHPDLAALAAWYARHFPEGERRRPLVV